MPNPTPDDEDDVARSTTGPDRLCRGENPLELDALDIKTLVSPNFDLIAFKRPPKPQ